MKNTVLALILSVACLSVPSAHALECADKSSLQGRNKDVLSNYIETVKDRRFNVIWESSRKLNLTVLGKGNAGNCPTELFGSSGYNYQDRVPGALRLYWKLETYIPATPDEARHGNGFYSDTELCIYTDRVFDRYYGSDEQELICRP